MAVEEAAVESLVVSSLGAAGGVEDEMPFIDTACSSICTALVVRLSVESAG